MTLAEFLNRCSFARLSPELLQSCNSFKCGNEDLDEFFREDFRLYGEKLLGKTYVFRLRERPERSLLHLQYQTIQFESNNLLLKTRRRLNMSRRMARRIFAAIPEFWSVVWGRILNLPNKVLALQ